MIERVHNFDVLQKCTKDILSLIKPLENDRNKRLYAIQELQNSIYSIGALRGNLLLWLPAYCRSIFHYLETTTWDPDTD